MLHFFTLLTPACARITREVSSVHCPARWQRTPAAMQTLVASPVQAVLPSQQRAVAVRGRAAGGCLLALRGCAAPAALRAASRGACVGRCAAVQHAGAAARTGRRRSLVCAAGEGPAPADDDDVTYEPMRKARAKGTLQAKVKVSTPTVDAALGNAAPSELARNETTAVLLLTAVFLAIMVEGLLVASSGFMSEQWDGFVQARFAGVVSVPCCSLGLKRFRLTRA
jgi:hypothetical protein